MPLLATGLLLAPIQAREERATTDAAPATCIAVTHVAVVPMDREIVLEDQTVLVQDGRIVELGPAESLGIPEGALVLEGRGRWLLPALADMHVHVWDENDLFLFVANGVTTVRNMFGGPLHLAWKRRIEAGELVGPRIYTAGPIIDGSPAVWPGSVELTDPARAAAIVREQEQAGYDFLKPYSRLKPECYEALAVAAEEQGLSLMGHVPESLGLADVLEAGQRTIEHLDGWAEAAQPADSPFRTIGFWNVYEAWARVDAESLRALAAEMRETETWNCPTLVVQQKWARGAAAEAQLARPEMRFVSPMIKASWSPTSPVNYLNGMSDSFLASAHAALGSMQRAVAALRDARGGILLGTDMGNPFVVAGFSLHEELAYLVQAGLTPYQALRAGTADAARCLGAGAEWGTIAEGRAADLLLLEANPLEDARHAARRVGVLLRGRWLPETELRRELEDRAARFTGQK